VSIYQAEICSMDEQRVIDVWCGLEQSTISINMAIESNGIEDHECASIPKDN